MINQNKLVIELKESATPGIARILGYAGLIPFIGLALGLWVMPDQYRPDLNHALLTYAAIILSFMGAIHWGTAIELKNHEQKIQLGISVIPPLVAWLALLLPLVYSYSVLIVTFSGLCIFDASMTKRGKLPDWYPLLRVPLTTVVVATLITALLANTIL
jgi:positive regulator of sigma E activity